MSFLFSKRSRKVAKYVWSVLAVLVGISMVALFAPGLVNLIGH